MPDNFEVGKNIKRIRELRDFSQEYVASELGITQSQLSKMEKGLREIGLSDLRKLAEILRVDEYLFLDFHVETLLNHRKPVAKTAFEDSKKTTHEMVVSFDDEGFQVLPLPEIMYFMQ